jgi:hypothetical protein
MNRPTQLVVPKETPVEPDWVDVVRRHVGALRYGAVQIVVHDGHVIQVEKTERVRFDRPRPEGS